VNENPPTKLLGKLNAIMSEVDYMQKRSKTTGGSFSYSYVGEAQLKERLHPLFVKHGVIIVPVSAQLRREYHESDKIDSKTGAVYGKDRECFADVQMTFRIMDCESGEYIDGQFCGTGHDKPGDKAVYKAITAALRDFCKATFFIPTGLDPEADEAEETDPAKNAHKESKPHAAQKPVGDSPESAHDRAHHRLKEILDGNGVSSEQAIRYHARLSKVPEDRIEDFFGELNQELAGEGSATPPLSPTEKGRYAFIEDKFKTMSADQQSKLVALCSGSKCTRLEQLKESGNRMFIGMLFSKVQSGK